MRVPSPMAMQAGGSPAECPAVASGESLSGFFHAAWVCAASPSRTNPRADLGPAGGLRGRRATRPVDPVDDCTLDASSEETADGDPQMAECLWRSALSRGPAAMAGTIVARYNAFFPSVAGQ
jgi:hypothetical protein